MNILIRHGNDNKKSEYKHDNSLNLTDKTTTDIINCTRKLIELYGFPDKIYCSPFHRVRETVKIMNREVLKNNVHINVDPNLSRFFSKHERDNPSIKNDTLKYGPPIVENKTSFNARVDKIDDKINHNKKKNIWYITHYLVIKRIAKNHDITIPNHMPFLHAIHIK
jgi:broad specificity phosphatase PhoE